MGKTKKYTLLKALCHCTLGCRHSHRQKEQKHWVRIYVQTKYKQIEYYNLSVFSPTPTTNLTHETKPVPTYQNINQK